MLRGGNAPSTPSTGGDLKCGMDPLFGFDVGRADNLAPLLGFCGNEFFELGGGGRKHGAAQNGKPRLCLGIGESRIDLLVELLNNLRWGVFGSTDPLPPACFKARQELTYGRNIRQGRRARRSG